jgi:Fuc2NAc and GlcNAc transferase
MMMFLVTAALSAVLCALYIRIAHQRNILDHPNTRSSHTESTPHGGGVPLYLAFAIAVVIAMTNGTLMHWYYLLILAAALMLMVTGTIDDLHNLPVKLRLSVYACLTLGTTIILLFDHFLLTSLAGIGVITMTTLAVLWLLNLYNFMDGIDGIAALQAASACLVAAMLCEDVEYSLFCMLLAAAQLGFLALNRPPASLFMGDAGSIPTGYVLGTLAIMGAVQGVLDPLIWLVLLAIFITDATWTLLWRIFTGQEFMRAHRLHAYQRLSRHWGSHKKVDGLFLLILCFWLAPIAWVIDRYAGFDLFLVLLAYLPLICGMAKAGAIK